jgi:hypothetical protein
MATKKVTPKNPEPKTEAKADDKTASRTTAAFKMKRKTSGFRMK